jgi:hypothetical protein
MAAYPHQDIPGNRFVTQYREAPNLELAAETSLLGAVDAEAMFQELLAERSLETAVGYNLDVIGWIVGTFRFVDKAIVIPYFGFDGAIGAQTFGEVGTPATGGDFKSLNQPNFLGGELDDAGLRKLIKARILRNNTEGTIEDLLTVLLATVDNAAPVTVTETYPAEVGITFTDTLSDADKVMLTDTDMLPIPAGVTVTFADAGGPFS